MLALVIASLCEEALFAALPRDNCRINGEITGQFARNDRCRGSITGCELRRRLKLLLVQKCQRLGSFLLHHAFSRLPFVDIGLSVPLFRSIAHLSNHRYRSSARFTFSCVLTFFFSLHIFAFRISLPLFFSFSKTWKLSKTKRDEASFRTTPRLRTDLDRAGDNISSLQGGQWGGWVGGWVRRLKPARQRDFIGVYLPVMGMESFKTAGGYRNKETKMRCVCMCVSVFVYVRVLLRKKREKYTREGWRAKHIERARKEVFDQSYTCELSLRNSVKICKERGFLRDGWRWLLMLITFTDLRIERR